MNTQLLLEILCGDRYCERIRESRMIKQPLDPAPLDPGDVGELASATDVRFCGERS